MKGKWYLVYSYIKQGKSKRAEVLLKAKTEESAITEGGEKWKEVSSNPAKPGNPMLVYQVDL